MFIIIEKVACSQAVANTTTNELLKSSVWGKCKIVDNWFGPNGFSIWFIFWTWSVSNKNNSTGLRGTGDVSLMILLFNPVIWG